MLPRVVSGESRWWHDGKLTEVYLRDAYTGRGLTVREIAEETGANARSVHRRIVQADIPVRSRGARATRRDGYAQPADVLGEDYLVDATERRKLSLDRIAAETGFTVQTVRRFTRFHRVEPVGPASFTVGHRLDRDQLARLVAEGLSFREIGVRLGCGEATVVGRVYDWGLSPPRRPRTGTRSA
jgi:transposase